MKNDFFSSSFWKITVGGFVNQRMKKISDLITFVSLFEIRAA